MNILLLTQWFDPEPTFKGLAFARELAAKGHTVEVLTGFPNYPGGHVHAGFKIRPWRRETIAGISIIRVALYPSHNKSVADRILGYLSFALSAALVGPALVGRTDVIYVNNEPPTIGIAAIVLALFRRAPFVLDIGDLWPDSVSATRVLSNKLTIAVLNKWCTFLYSCASHIVVVTPGYRDRLLSRGVPRAKVDVVYNWCDDSVIAPAGPPSHLLASLGFCGFFNIVFAGNMGVAQGLDSVLDAAVLCITKMPDVRFIFIGDGVDRNRLQSRAKELGLSNVGFLQQQPMNSIGAVLAAADALLVHLKRDPLFTITIPSKTQAYMAAGKPLIMAVSGDAADLVIQSGCGVVCEPENPASIADAVTRVAALSSSERRAMGAAGARFYSNNLSISHGVGKFESIFARVTKAADPAVDGPVH